MNKTNLQRIKHTTAMSAKRSHALYANHSYAVNEPKRPFTNKIKPLLKKG